MQFVRYNGVFLCLFLFTPLAHADIYKWVDEHGQTHFSQLPPPVDQPAKIIKKPPPPATDPEAAQQELDALIKQQEKADELEAEREKQQRLEAEKAKRAEQRQQNCRTAQHNLQQYKNNPGRRFIDSEGNVTRLGEEKRQEMIKQSQQAIDQFCN